MARKVVWGTPGRTEHYVFPRKPYAFVLPALALAAVATFLLLFLHLVGLRTAVVPGGVISSHATVEKRCEECHAVRAGASNPRCERCHDPVGATRLTNRVHVLFGSGDAKKAAAAPDLACARCHVEHRGRDTKLSSIDQAHCFQCHFRRFSAHPEFAVLRSKSSEVPGLKYPHDCHVRELVKDGSCKDAAFDPGPAAWTTCVKCHEPTPGGRDLDRISFDRHCASCHGKNGTVGTMDPISLQDVVGPDAIRTLGVKADWLHPEEFESSRGKITKTVLRHKDEWVLFNIWALRRAVDPEGYAAERGAQVARIDQLRRKLVLAAPLAGLDLAALRGREAALVSELRGLDGRLRGQQGAQGPSAGLDRLDEVALAVSATGDEAARKEVQSIKERADALRKQGVPIAPLPAEDFEARRKQLLGLLEAVEAADPDQKGRAEDLRRRLQALSPGQPARELLARVRDQRAADLERVRDEIGLRSAGVSAPRVALLVGEQRAIQRALDSAEDKLRRISEGPAPPPALSADDRERKKGALEALTAACLKCHVSASGSLARVSAARPVLVRSTFVHAPHLIHADCTRCHAGIEKSHLSQDLNFRGIASCQECHGSGRARQDCQSCHLYHPPQAP